MNCCRARNKHFAIFVRPTFASGSLKWEYASNVAWSIEILKTVHKTLKSWNIQTLTVSFNPTGMAWIREGTTSPPLRRGSSFLALLWNTSAARVPGHRHTPLLTHHLTGLFLTTPPAPSYTVLWAPSFNPPPTHFYTSWHTYSFTPPRTHTFRQKMLLFPCSFLLFPFLRSALGPCCNCLCVPLSFVGAHRHSRMHDINLAHFANKIIPRETPTEETSKIQTLRIPDPLMKVSHPLLKQSSSSLV